MKRARQQRASIVSQRVYFSCDQCHKRQTQGFVIANPLGVRAGDDVSELCFLADSTPVSVNTSSRKFEMLG